MKMVHIATTRAGRKRGQRVLFWVSVFHKSGSTSLNAESPQKDVLYDIYSSKQKK